jgi:4-hydroxy-tetrahydrodipicolinate synthase
LICRAPVVHVAAKSIIPTEGGIIAPMAPANELGAILTAMVTPFGDGGELNEDAARRLARHLIENGSDGLVVAGTTGESPTLSDEEKLRLLDVVIDEVGEEATVIAGTGSNDTAHSVELTKAAGKRDVDAVLVVTPYYNKPSRKGLVAHFEAVAGATDTPVMLYNIPSRCVINLDPELQIELGRIDNIVAVKQANADLDQARRIIEAGTLAVYAGDDSLVRPFAEIGGAGGVCVSSHLFGRQMKEVWECARRGDSKRASDIEGEIQDVYDTIFMTVGTATMKAALNLLGHEVGGLRLPLVSVTDDELGSVRAMLERHDLAAPATRE